MQRVTKVRGASGYTAKAKRRLRALGLLVVVLGLLDPAAAGASKGVKEVREAWAEWRQNVRASGHYDSYELAVRQTRDSISGAIVTRALVSLKRCRPVEYGTYCAVAKQTRWFVAPNSAFKVADDLTSGRARVKAFGFVHRVKWSGASDLFGWQSDSYCGDVLFAHGKGFYRDATARGRMFGKEMPRNNPDRDWSTLSREVVVDPC